MPKTKRSSTHPIRFDLRSPNYDLRSPISLRQIAMPLSGRSAQRPDCSTQVQLWCGRLSERAVPARLHPDTDERGSHHGAARAAKMSARRQMVWPVAQVSQLRGSVAQSNTSWTTTPRQGELQILVCRICGRKNWKKKETNKKFKPKPKNKTRVIFRLKLVQGIKIN